MIDPGSVPPEVARARAMSAAWTFPGVLLASFVVGWGAEAAQFLRLPGPRARDARLAPDAARVRGRGRDRVEPRRPAHDRELHRLAAAPDRAGVADDLLRQLLGRAAAPALRAHRAPGHARREPLGVGGRAAAAAGLLHADLGEGLAHAPRLRGPARALRALPGRPAQDPAGGRGGDVRPPGGPAGGARAPGRVARSRRLRAVPRRRHPALPDHADVSRLDARPVGHARRLAVRVRPVGGAVPLRVPGEGHGVLLGADAATRPTWRS